MVTSTPHVKPVKPTSRHSRSSAAPAHSSTVRPRSSHRRPDPRVSRLTALLLSPLARPLRALGTGSLSALVQFALLDILIDWRHWHPLPASALALLLGAQVNFVLSYLVTWHDRQADRRRPGLIPQRWLAYQVATIGTAALNIVVFLAARDALPTLAAAAVGNIVAGVVNFVLNDRLVFHRR